MTVTRVTITRPLVRDVRSARGRGRVHEGGGQAAGKTIKATTITGDDACRRGWRTHRCSLVVPSAGQPTASLVIGPFKLQ